MLVLLITFIAAKFSMQVAIANILLAIAVVLLTGCKTPGSASPIGPVEEIEAPLGLPPVPVPRDNPPTAQTITLGRQLFYDVRLSKDNSVSCASCHNPTLAFTDGRKVSKGVGGMSGVRNAPTLLNAAYSPLQFWDGRASTLEQQSGDPMVNSVEMNQPHEITVSKIGKDPKYQKEFEQAFGPGAITLEQIEESLASFERTLLSGDSPFDRYAFGGDKAALTPAAVRGLAVFIDPKRGNCAVCHTIDFEHKYALFTDGKFHNTGAGIDGEGKFSDPGRFSETRLEADRGAFKTPTLRNIALTPPYMHDGSLKTLKDVVDFYAGGGNSNSDLDKEMKAISLSGHDRTDLVALLESLTGEMPTNIGTPKE
jgi:cytochrome c peroxidase